jgi:hypothetical protein
MAERELTEIQYHFEGVHSASSSEDGQHILLSVSGDAGVCGISIPAKTIGPICSTLLEANAEARKRSGDKTIQASAIRSMKVLNHPDPDQAILAITIHTGAAPVAFSLPQATLVNFARGVLERRGLLPIELPSRPQ